MQQIGDYVQPVLDGNLPDKADFLGFVERWLVRHIVEDDHDYGAFLNGKGVY